MLWVVDVDVVTPANFENQTPDTQSLLSTPKKAQNNSLSYRTSTTHASTLQKYPNPPRKWNNHASQRSVTLRVSHAQYPPTSDTHRSKYAGRAFAAGNSTEKGKENKRPMLKALLCPKENRATPSTWWPTLLTLAFPATLLFFQPLGTSLTLR